jgi:hypothetical protein
VNPAIPRTPGVKPAYCDLRHRHCREVHHEIQVCLPHAAGDRVER